MQLALFGPRALLVSCTIISCLFRPCALAAAAPVLAITLLPLLLPLLLLPPLLIVGRHRLGMLTVQGGALQLRSHDAGRAAQDQERAGPQREFQEILQVCHNKFSWVQASAPVRWRRAHPAPARRAAEGCTRRPPLAAVAAVGSGHRPSSMRHVLCGYACAKGFVWLRQAAAVAEAEAACSMHAARRAAAEAAVEGPSPRARREGICGSCAMNIDGTNWLACTTKVRLCRPWGPVSIAL